MATYTIAGDVATFEEAAFKRKLAAALPDVGESEISLHLVGASVLVTALLAISSSASSREATLAALDALAVDVEAASSTLGVTVEAASAPIVTQRMIVVPRSVGGGLSTGVGGGLSTGVVIAIACGAGGALLLVLALVCCYCRGKTHASRREAAITESNGVRFRGSSVPPPPPDEGIEKVHQVSVVATEHL